MSGAGGGDVADGVPQGVPTLLSLRWKRRDATLKSSHFQSTARHRWRERGNPNLSWSFFAVAISLLQGGRAGWGCEDEDRRGSRQRRNNAASNPPPPQSSGQPAGPPEARLRRFPRSCALEGVGTVSGRKLIYRSGAAGSGTGTEGGPEGPTQCRGVRNGAEVEREETEAENGPGILPGSTCALPSLQARTWIRHLRAIVLVDLCVTLEDHRL